MRTAGSMRLVAPLLSTLLVVGPGMAAEPPPVPRSFVYMRGVEGPVTRDPAAIDAARVWMHEIDDDWLPVDILTPEQRSREFRGETHLILSVDVEGGVTGCEIVKSDLAADQDGKICGLLTKPRRFERRYIDAGKAIAWQATFKVVTGTVMPKPQAIGKPPPALPPLPVLVDRPPWPRIFYGGKVYASAFPRLADGLPHGVAARGRTTVDVTVNAADGVTKCEVIQASEQASLDAFACATATALPFRWPQMTPGSTTETIPLQFVWDKKQSHIRAPLPSGRFASVVSPHDPLDPRERRPQRTMALLLDAPALPPHALEGIIIMTSLFRSPWFHVDYDVAGRPTRCHTVTTSGDAQIDAALCRHASSEWRFQPAEDVFGDPVAGKWSGTIAF